MSKVTQREQIETVTTEPMSDGSYSEREYRAFAWRCDGCGLVWEKRHLAEGCEAREHRAAFEAGPYGGYVENGVHKNGRYYPRRALRREKVSAGLPMGQVAVAAPRRETTGEYHARMDALRATQAATANASEAVLTSRLEAARRAYDERPTVYAWREVESLTQRLNEVKRAHGTPVAAGRYEDAPGADMDDESWRDLARRAG